MRKIIFILAVSATMVACKNGNANQNAANGSTTDSLTTDTAANDSLVYEGTTPAADADGIKYRLALVKDSTQGFALTESYMQNDSIAESTENHTGKYAIVKKNDKNGKENTYYEFPVGTSDKAIFLVADDATLRMVNSNYEEAVPVEGMSYDLKLKK